MGPRGSQKAKVKDGGSPNKGDLNSIKNTVRSEGAQGIPRGAKGALGRHFPKSAKIVYLFVPHPSPRT